MYRISVTDNRGLGAVHKVRHAIFGQFLPPPPVTLCHTFRDLPKVRHTSRTPSPIFSRPSTTKPGQKPLVQILSQLFARVFVRGGFVRGSFVLKVLSRVVFVRSPFCQNTSVTTES